MPEITVRVLSERDWELYKRVRLTALKESPEAFVADHETEAAYDEALWRKRMNRATRFLAEQGGEPVGILSTRPDDTIYENAVQAFGLWVTPPLRGMRVATGLMDAAQSHAASAGHNSLLYWVGTDNGRAVAFASSYGFRPTEYRRPMEIAGSSEDDEEELAMALALRP